MNLPEPSSVHRVGVIGAGTIGASWAAYFLARGMEVQAWDPAPDAEAALRAFVAEAWPTLDGLDVVADGAGPDRLTFHAGPAAAVDGVEFVQESAPEKLDVKRTLYAEIDTVLPGDVVMASSTSGLIMSKLQSGFTNAARFVVGASVQPAAPHSPRRGGGRSGHRRERRRLVHRLLQRARKEGDPAEPRGARPPR